MTDQDEKPAVEEEKPVDDGQMSIDDALKAAWDAQSEEKEPSEPAETREDAEKEPSEAAPVEATPEPETPTPAAAEMPAYWGEDGMAVWSALTPEQQATVAAKDAANREAMEKDRLPDGMRGLLDQIGQNAQAYGVSAEDALERLFTAHRLLEQNGPEGILRLANQYRVDLSSLGAKAPDPQTPDDPAQQLLNAVDQRLNAFAQQMQGQQAERQIQEQASEIEEWSKEVDASGTPLRPHFKAVEHLLPQAVQKVREDNPGLSGWKALETAYKRLEPLAAPQDVDALVAQKVEEALKVKAAEAAKAQQAAISPAAGVSGQNVPQTSSGSIDDDLSAAWKQLQQGNAGRIQ